MASFSEPGPSLVFPLNRQRDWSLLLQGKWDVVFPNISSIKCKCSFQKRAAQIHLDILAMLLYILLPELCRQMSSERASGCPHSCRGKVQNVHSGKTICKLGMRFVFWNAAVNNLSLTLVWQTSPFRLIQIKIRNASLELRMEYRLRRHHFYLWHPKTMLK